ncbi:MAG: hypothetical protein PHI47_04585 [Sulfuricurvum sp.]|uniref:LamG-like jellyroll fold domain-containing protein n=1 Tax=Sulfuricurvum sp. TaxID=2025608 RepID=UPI00262FF062|nr:LamG-like jellyroll fold domain-containing protein [Sulfuricurvum sp.]MDD5159304.1 hypothetical protein [Sulfuricurvum sp.]
MYLKIIFFTLLFAFNLLRAATLSLESGSVTIDNSENAATCKSFRQTYAVPPVVYVMMDDSGNNNAIIKLTNVTTTQFCAKVMETIFEDGPHVSVPAYYVAIPQGVYRLPDGTKVEAGIKTISNVVNDDRISNSWTTLTFNHAYSQPPSVITQLQTLNNELPAGNTPTGRGTTNNAISLPWVTETVNNITSSSAQIALDKSHIIETGLSITQGEKVGYFVIESNKFGSFTATDTGTNPVYYQTFLSGNVFGGYDQTCQSVSINNAFPTSGYLFIASKAINNASYGGWFRKCAETSRKIGLLIDSKRAKGSGKVSGQKWATSASPDYGLSTRNHPAAPASIAVFSRSFDLSRVVNDANLSVNALVQPSTVIESGSLTMDVNVSNKGPDSAPNTVLSLSLPSGMTFQQITSGGANWSCAQNSNALDCNLTSGALAANTTSMLSLKFSAPSIANFYTVNVSAASDGLDDDGAGTTAQFQVYNLLVDDDKAECPTASFTTISSALNMAHSGDTLRICKGTYTENVAVNVNDINITSNSGIATDVIVKGSNSNAFTVNKSNVGIKNLSIVQNVSNSRAVLADNAANLTLDNLVISYTNGSNEAIKLQNSSTTPILKNITITSDQSGIKMDGANSFALTNLNITAGSNGGNYGIYGWNINTASSLSQITVQSGDNAIQVVSSQKVTMTDINANSSVARAIYIPNGTFSLGVSTWASNTLAAQMIALQGDSAGAFSVQNTNASSTTDTVMKFSNVGSNTFTFTDNNITGNSANSYGVYIDGGGSASIIQRNIIRNATTNQGLRLLNNPTFSSKISNNCFMNNLTHNANVSNSGNSQFNGNFWGNTSGIAVTPDYTDTNALSYCPLTSTTVLIADYHFDECTWNGTNAEVKDISGNNLHGTAQGSAQTSLNGIIDHAGNFNNSASNTDAIIIPDSDLLSPHTGTNGEITISAWVKLNSYPTSALQGRIPIVAKGDNNNWEYALYVYQDHKAGFSVWQSSGSSYMEISGGSLSLNTWYHITGVLKKGVFERVYVNGAVVAESTSGFSGSTTNGTSPLYVARRGSGNNYLNGYVDEVKIFPNALSSAQISAIENNESMGNNYDGTARTASCCCIPTGGNLIANPSFETLCNSNILTAFGNVAGGTVNSRSGLCGWDVAYSLETWENTTSPAASNGTIFTEIDGNGGQVDKIWQTLNTAAGTNYIISFDYRKRDTSHSDFIIAKWNDVAMTQVEGNTAGWQTAQIQVTGTAGTDKISFEEPSTSDDGYGSWIDNIRVEQGALATDCTSFKYEPYHSYNASLSPSYRLQTRITNQPFDVNVTVACADSGTIPSRKIKNIYAIDALATSCNAVTPKLFTLLSNGAYDINETSRVITIPNLNITKAYSNIKFMLETNASEFNCSSDSFAIRPPSFSITSPTTSAKAANFTLQISANNSGTGYHGTANVTTGLQAPNPNCPVSSGFLKSSISPTEPLSLIFQNDSNSSTAKATDVGTIYLNTKDTTWTAIDQSNDCIVDSNTTIMNTQGLLGCNIENNLSLSITPDHFDVNATLSDFGGGFTYLSNDLNMSAQLGLIITAENDENATTQNYTAGCYSKDTTVTLPHSDVPDPLTKILYSEALSGVNSNVIKSNPWILTFNSGLFNSGSVAPNIDLNFDRNETKPLNPFNFTVTSATATDPDATGTGTPLGTAQFIYGRVRAYDIATNISPVDVPVEFEVYSTTASGFVNGMPQNVLHWYRNLNHDAANQGNVMQGGFSSGTVNSNVNVSAAPQEGVQIVTITSTTDQTVHLDISKWLWYSSNYGYLYSGTCTQHPCFKYDYTDASTGVNGVNSGTFKGSDFQMAPAKNITNKGVKIFR